MSGRYRVGATEPWSVAPSGSGTRDGVEVVDMHQQRAAPNAGAGKGSFSRLCDRDLVEWTYGLLSVASDSIFVLGAIHQSEKQQTKKQHEGRDDNPQHQHGSVGVLINFDGHGNRLRRSASAPRNDQGDRYGDADKALVSALHFVPPRSVRPVSRA